MTLIARNRGFARHPCCMHAGTIDYFSCGKRCGFTLFFSSPTYEKKTIKYGIQLLSFRKSHLLVSIEVLHGSHVALQENENILHQKEIFLIGKIIYCSCHASWRRAKPLFHAIYQGLFKGRFNESTTRQGLIRTDILPLYIQILLPEK